MKYTLVLILSITISISSCLNETTPGSDGINELLDVNEFSKYLKSENQLVDVRTPEEFSEGFIPNAENINYINTDFEKMILKLDKTKPVLLYCESGGRSGKAYTLLKSKGYDKVFDLKGGFKAWKAAGMMIEK